MVKMFKLTTSKHQISARASREMRRHLSACRVALLLTLFVVASQTASCWQVMQDVNQLLAPIASQQVAEESRASQTSKQQATSVIESLQISARQLEQTPEQPEKSNLALAGKILEAISVANGSAGSAQQTAGQVLRPRKVAQADKQLSSAEQQIVNQHARVHLSGHSHQRLLPTKQRDQKLAALTESAGSSRDSPIHSLLDNLKSGISSRSSIVKAISDNKLARTLTEVGKSIGGNKLVAGAAAASVMAALGLTVSKLLSPYLFASSYSKFGQDPMLASGSAFNPIAYQSNERNLYYPVAGEQMLAAASSQSPLTRSQQASQQPADQYAYLDSNYATEATNQMPTQLFYPSTPAVFMPQYNPNREQLYVADYNAKLDGRYRTVAPAESSGHYSSFYAQQGIATEQANGQDQYEQPTANFMPNQQETGYLGQQRTNYDTSTGERQFAPSNRHIYMPTTYTNPSALAAADSRRSGAVTLKLDEATRARLHQYIKRQQSQQQQFVANEMKGGSNSDQSHLFASYSRSPTLASSSGFVPMQAAESSATGEFVARPLVKSNRANLEKGLSATAQNSRAAATLKQGQPKTGDHNKLTYVIIRPKTTSSDNQASATGDRLTQSQPQSPGAGATLQSSWKSLPAEGSSPSLDRPTEMRSQSGGIKTAGGDNERRAGDTENETTADEEEQQVVALRSGANLLEGNEERLSAAGSSSVVRRVSRPSVKESRQDSEASADRNGRQVGAMATAQQVASLAQSSAAGNSSSGSFADERDNKNNVIKASETDDTKRLAPREPNDNGAEGGREELTSGQRRTDETNGRLVETGRQLGGFVGGILEE